MDLDTLHILYSSAITEITPDTGEIAPGLLWIAGRDRNDFAASKPPCGPQMGQSHESEANQADSYRAFLHHRYRLLSLVLDPLGEVESLGL